MISESKAQEYKRNYANHKDYFYGNHYLTPANLFHFMIRLEPYTKAFKELHDGSLDIPDRIFSSLEQTIESVKHETDDVRELIPEFYSLPEFLLNINGLEFGEDQQKQKISNVKMLENPYSFVYNLRKFLELSASEMISKWIDLIFGFKQRGEKAAQFQNLYQKFCYDNYCQEKIIRNEEEREAFETQMYFYGQIPFQLFQIIHPSKNIQTPSISLISQKQTIQYFVKKRKEKLLDPVHLLREFNNEKNPEYSRELFVITEKTIQRFSFQINTFSKDFTKKLLKESKK